MEMRSAKSANLDGFRFDGSLEDDVGVGQVEIIVAGDAGAEPDPKRIDHVVGVVGVKAIGRAAEV